jgi:preprotein translocase subunit YajC
LVLAASKNSGSAAGLLIYLIPLALIAFLFIRSSRARRAAAEKTQTTLEPGTEVVTIGGLIGRVTAVDDDAVHIEVAPGVVCRYLRRAIGQVVAPPAVAEDDLDARPELPPDDRPPAP